MNDGHTRGRLRPKGFGPAFRDKATWSAWFAFLAALFALPMSDEQLAIYRECTGRAEPPARRANEAWLVCGRRAASPSPSPSSPSSSAASATGDRSSALASAPR